MSESFDIENFPASESARKMLSYVSDGFYDESYVGKWLFQVMGIEYDSALEIVGDLPAQFFPETATWGMMFHEIKWGLPVRENLPYEERRRLIYQKRDCRVPMTPYRMEGYLKNATGFDVFVADCHDPGPYGYVPPHPNMFKVFFVGSETLDVKNARKIINRLKQSHTIYELNDRIESDIDESGTEEIRLVNVKFHFIILFWDCSIFDGSRCFGGGCDTGGFILFDNVRRYDVRIGIKYHTGIMEKLQDTGIYSVIVRWKQHTNERMGAGMTDRFVEDLFAGWGSTACLTVCSEIGLSGQETVGNLTVETRTEDCRFFDGTVFFEGCGNFNSIYRKETVE